MKLSTRGRYSLQMMIAVARHSNQGKPVKLAEVSRRTSISRHYLEQLCIHMKNNGLLKTVCGKNGGYLLGRPAEAITAEQIIEAAIGPINIAEGGFQNGSPELEFSCDCQEIFHVVNRQIKDTLSSFTLADLAAQRVRRAAEKRAAMA